MNRNPACVQYHLTGDEKLRDTTNGFSGVEICTKVLEEIASAAMNEIGVKTLERDSAAAAEMADAGSKERARNMKHATLTKSPLLKIAASASDLFDGTATPHSRLDSFLFRKMIDDIQAAGPG